MYSLLAIFSVVIFDEWNLLGCTELKVAPTAYLKVRSLHFCMYLTIFLRYCQASQYGPDSAHSQTHDRIPSWRFSKCNFDLVAGETSSRGKGICGEMG